MALKLMGKKRGMTMLFDDKGHTIVGTIIEVEPNVVTQIKTKDTDGYTAIQLGFEKVKVKDPRTMDRRVAKPQRGHYTKAAVEPRRYLAESRLEDVENYTVGQEIGVAVFAELAFVDATGVSKGKGYQGVIKLHNYAGGPASHGSSFHRHAGSRGMRTTPGRVFPGGKAASHMGHEQKTVQNLEVVKVDAEENIIVVKGQVPGPRNGLVYLSQAVKKPHAKKKNS